jgi:hypothetical protein
VMCIAVPGSPSYVSKNEDKTVTKKDNKKKLISPPYLGNPLGGGGTCNKGESYS